MAVTNGIDVSNYQGKIDWAKVKADGTDFVIIRAGRCTISRIPIPRASWSSAGAWWRSITAR